MIYTYADVLTDILTLYDDYPFLQIFQFGHSALGKPLYGIKIGNGAKKVLYVSAHHALEWLTAEMLMSFVGTYAAAIEANTEICAVNAYELSQKCSMYIIPMLNPDGIDLVAGKIPKNSDTYQELLNTLGNADFAHTWQANINGVDLNHNYDASFSPILSAPAPTRYGGTAPESEPESRALANLTRSIRPDLVIAFHSQGREIYYDFEGYAPPRGKELADEFARISGYQVSQPSDTAAFGGYKDWFIKEFDKPGFTIEIGLGKNPIGSDQLEQVLRENTCIMIFAADNA